MTSGRTVRVQEGERNSRRDVRPETAGREDTGGTGQYGSIVRRPGKKAFDTTPREMVVATQRWMGVPEAEVRMVAGLYEKTTARVVVGEGASDEFEVKTELRQGSVLSPLLFIAILVLISRNTVMKDAITKLIHADDLVLMANCKQELLETLDEWNGLFARHGVKLSLEKTGVLHAGHQGEELDIHCWRGRN